MLSISLKESVSNLIFGIRRLNSNPIENVEIFNCNFILCKRLFVDAEQTYFQDAIHCLTIELMREFNKSKCFILNTYQNYLKSAYTTLSEDIELSIKDNFYFGAKLVRGAYMEQERERAAQMKYEDPINENYDATTQMYEKSLMYCMNIIKGQPFGRISVMVASHNEQTVKFAVEK